MSKRFTEVINMQRVQDHWRTTLALKMALANWRRGQKERNTLWQDQALC